MRFRLVILAVLAGFIVSPLHAQNCLPSIEGNAFKAGERLDYTLQFKWGAVNADVASAVLSLDSVLFRGAPAYHSVITVKSAPFFDFFFKMREKFQGWMTVEGFRPLKFIRDTHEGTYVATNLYYYDWEQNVIHADVNFEGRGKEHYEIPLKPCVYDIGSILYFARNMDTRALVKGGKYPLSFAIDDSVFDVFLTYKGREVIRDYFIGDINTLLFSCSVVSGAMFTGEEEFLIWISADRNHLPVSFMAPLRVGAVRGWLKAYSGLKYPFKPVKK